MKIDKEILKEIVDLADSVPELYRAKCFELLLQNTLLPRSVNHKDSIEDGTLKDDLVQSHNISVATKSFLEQNGILIEKVLELFQAENGIFIPLYSIDITKSRAAQIHHALMLAFENSLKDGKFLTDIETLRNRCVLEKCYNGANFKSYLKQANNLFKNLPSGELILTNEGKAELVALLKKLIS